MDLLRECAVAFQRLLGYEYHFVVGRKGQIRELEMILDDNETVFRYNEKAHKFSLIKADYLLEGQMRLIPVYLFLGKRCNDELIQMCRTFFRKEDKDYTQGQPRYTLLKKEKKNVQTGETIVQYNSLK